MMSRRAPPTTISKYRPQHLAPTRCSRNYIAVRILLIVLFLNNILLVVAVRNIQVAFPLQSLTIWDPEVLPPLSRDGKVGDDDDAVAVTITTPTTALLQDPSPFSFRAKFLSKFQKGLQAEVKTRNLMQQQPPPTPISGSDGKRNTSVQVSSSKGRTQLQQKQWAAQAARNDQKKHRIREAMVEKAYDDAVQQHERKEVALPQQPRLTAAKLPRKNPNRYQFVGVINSHPRHDKNAAAEAPITWYTRTKPKHAKWTIRLIHVNRAAILKDLYHQKKIDIFAHYRNDSAERRRPNNNNNNDPSDGTGVTRPMVTGQYIVRERSWKNLWNMSLKHLFTDSSGMYWRERRIHSTQENDMNHPYLYTDGNHVYEATYRYMPDGRNGMHKVSTLAEFLNSRSIDAKMKQRIVQRLQQDTPDIVLEE